MNNVLAGMLGIVIGALIAGVAFVASDDCESRVDAAQNEVTAAKKETADAVAKASAALAAVENEKQASSSIRVELDTLKSDVDQDLLVQLTRTRLRVGQLERESDSLRRLLFDIAPNEAAELIEQAERPPEKIIEVTAAELLQAFDDNEISAEQRFTGRMVVVRGTVVSVGTALLGEPYVMIADNADEMLGVQCVFESSSGLESLHRGDIVEIEGRCSRRTLNVIVWECKLK